MNYQRITADEIQVGDKVARSRNARFYEVAFLRRTEVAIRIGYAGRGGGDRPRRDAKWWREVA